MNKTSDRIRELEEELEEFILNESVFEDENPSWIEVAEVQAQAEQQWNETENGKELKRLLKQK